MNDNYLDVLRKYEGEEWEVRRGRGAWICQSPRGIKLLKEYRGSLKRLEFEEAILQELKNQGICQVDQYIRNQDGELITTGDDGTKYILKDWFADRECNLKDSREVLSAVAWMARLHRAFRTISWREEWNLGSMQPPGLSEEMERHSREMKRVRMFIRNKRKKVSLSFVS